MIYIIIRLCMSKDIFVRRYEHIVLVLSWVFMFVYHFFWNNRQQSASELETHIHRWSVKVEFLYNNILDDRSLTKNVSKTLIVQRFWNLISRISVSPEIQIIVLSRFERWFSAWEKLKKKEDDYRILWRFNIFDATIC